MPASSGVLFPFRLLHFTHAAVRFSHVSSPPRERGIIWSTVRGTSPLPQYWQRCPSRRKIFFRERIIFLYGTRIKTERRTTLGNGIDIETERIIFPLDVSTNSALPRKSRIIAFFTLQMLNGS